MIVEPKKYISARCPVCNERISAEITPFLLNGGFDACCNVCGNNFIKIYKKPNKKYLISQHCLICDSEHKFDISFGSLWKKKITALACPASTIDICYIGDYDRVNTASDRLDSELQGFATADPEEIYKNADPLFHLAIAELNLKLSRNRVLCMCGQCTLIVRLSQMGITLTCGNCDAKEFIPLQNQKDLDTFLARETILLI